MKEMTRTQKAKLNMLFSLLQQGITLICGLIVPRLMLNSFGSEAYGATSSIASFLLYITLLEGGIGAVTRSALYRAIASKSSDQISDVIAETKSFYRKIAIAFIAYVVFIACFFQTISHNTTFGYWYSFFLVIVISISTFGEYYIGISYSLLLQADQASYIVAIFRIFTTVLNTIGIVILTSLKCEIIIVKLASSIVFFIRPLLLSLYVRKRYRLKKANQHKHLLVNKGTAVGQHIAWTLHNNTDITVLTVFKNLSLVSVYSVHNMIVSQIQSILGAFSSGMEAVFGSMYANQENENLQKTFGYYETLISLLSVTLFSIAAIMIVPFIKLYTAGIVDAQYENPVFAVLLIIASMLYTFRTPYGHMIIAAGRLKETRVAAYGEAIINIISSIVLVNYLGIVGVVIGTILATVFRFVFYVHYLSKEILYRKMYLWIKRMIINFMLFILIFLIGYVIISRMTINTYSDWAITSVIVSMITGLITLTINAIFYRNDIRVIINRGLKKMTQL